MSIESQGKVNALSMESKVMVKGKSTKVNGGQIALARGNWIQDLSRRPRFHAPFACLKLKPRINHMIAFRTVPVHRLAERLHSQSSPQNLWVGAYGLGK